jgi:hypothetical protein
VRTCCAGRGVSAAQTAAGRRVCAPSDAAQREDVVHS